MTHDDGTHECPAPECARRVQFERLACPTHWRAIPTRVQVPLLRAWRDAPGSDRYFKARAECLASLGVQDDAIAALNGGVSR